MIASIIFVILISVAVSAFCSLMEASIFAVPLPHAKHLANQNKKSGKILLNFKSDMSKPISAILILNTVSNTVGAAITGALVAKAYGDNMVLIFSVVFTCLILIFSEIIPKQLGATHAKMLADRLAKPLLGLIKSFSWLIYLTDKLTDLLPGASSQALVSSEEVQTMAELAREHGAIDKFKGVIIKNIIDLEKILVRDAMTPASVVFRLPADISQEELAEKIADCNFTRIPIYNSDNPDKLDRFVIQRDVLRMLIADKTQTLPELSRPLTSVIDLMPLDKVLHKLFDLRENIAAVFDERGTLKGVITLEDILEEIIGREIVDEYDSIIDMHAYARFIARRKDK